jgi:putative oxidoreductase
VNVLLWVLQVLLAVFFVWHGWLYVAPPADLQPALEQMGLPAAFRVFIGLAEWLGAAGLVLPALTRVAPWLTPLAALGLMVVTGSAVVFHLTRGELASVPMVAVLFALLAVVAYGRWALRPISPRAAPPTPERA